MKNKKIDYETTTVILAALFAWFLTSGLACIIPKDKYDVALLFILGGISLVLLAVFAILWYYEGEKLQKQKNNLISKLTKNEFTKIELEETNNEIYDRFLKNCLVEAKIHPVNDEIVILRFSSSSDEKDEKDEAKFKEILFKKEDLLETIAEIL